MKKNFILINSRLLLLVVCFSLSLGGCVSSATPIAYVSSVPPEQTCTLKVVGTLTVKSFNGEEVDWKPGGFDAWALVRIPEGSNTFVLDYERHANGRRMYQNGITITYDGFVAGRTYEMVAAAGAEAGGFSGLFTNMLGAMLDTVNQALRIGIRDTTNGQEGDFTWLAWD